MTNQQEVLDAAVKAGYTPEGAQRVIKELKMSPNEALIFFSHLNSAATALTEALQTVKIVNPAPEIKDRPVIARAHGSGRQFRAR
jgi:hypothetical protein